MKLSNNHIAKLQEHLKRLYSLDYTDEQAQEAGMAIMRFIVAKAHRADDINNNQEDIDHG